MTCGRGIAAGKKPAWLTYATRGNNRPYCVLPEDQHRLVICDLDLRHFDPKINEFTRLIMEHFYVMFGDASCIRFGDIMRINKLTNATESPNAVTAVCVSGYDLR